MAVMLVWASAIPVGRAQDAWSLDSCIRYAMAHNPGLRMSELNADLAALGRRTAIGGLFPTLNGQATHGYNWGQRIDPFTNQFAAERVRSNNLAIATSVNVFSGFQQINQVRQAELDTETARWNNEKAQNDLALNVASAYLTVLLNEEIASIASTNVSTTGRQVDRMRKLVESGQAAQSALDQLLAQLATDQANEVSAQNNVALARLSLVQLMQLEASFEAVFQIERPAPDEWENPALVGTAEAAVQAALANFPEIRAAQTALLSAEKGEAIARGGRYPRLTASYSYGSGYSGAARVLSGSPDSLSFPVGTVFGSNDIVLSIPQAVYTSEDYTVKPFNEQLRDNINQALFFNLTIPIFNGFTAEAGVQRAKINRRNAEYRLEQARQQLRQEVERAFADARAAASSYQASRISREASGKAFSWMTRRFEEGAANQMEYEASRNNLDVARATEARNRYDFIFKAKVLEFYQGKPISLNP